MVAFRPLAMLTVIVAGCGRPSREQRLHLAPAESPKLDCDPEHDVPEVMTESWVIENAATPWLDAYRRSDERGASVYDERPWSNPHEHRRA